MEDLFWGVGEPITDLDLRLESLQNYSIDIPLEKTFSRAGGSCVPYHWDGNILRNLFSTLNASRAHNHAADFHRHHIS